MMHIESIQRQFCIQYLPVDSQSADLEGFADLIEWWRSLFVGGMPPKFSDIRFTDLAGWHSRLTVCRVLDGAKDLEVRIAGENVRALYKNKIGSGALLSELLGVCPKVQQSHVQTLVKPPKIALIESLFHLGYGENIAVKTLDLPFGPTDGKDAHLLSLYEFDESLVFRAGV